MCVYLCEGGGGGASVCVYVHVYEREREADRQRQRDTERQTDRQTQRVTETERQTDRDRERERVVGQSIIRTDSFVSDTVNKLLGTSFSDRKLFFLVVCLLCFILPKPSKIGRTVPKKQELEVDTLFNSGSSVLIRKR